MRRAGSSAQPLFAAIPLRLDVARVYPGSVRRALAVHALHRRYDSGVTGNSLYQTRLRTAIVLPFSTDQYVRFYNVFYLLLDK